MRSVAIAGIGMTDIGVFDHAYPADLAVQAIVGAIKDSRRASSAGCWRPESPPSRWLRSRWR
jgi:hypothetical protein